MISLGIVQSRKKRRTQEVDQHCTSDWIDVPVVLPTWDSGSRAAEVLTDRAPDPGLPVECELTTKSKERSDAVQNERESIADEKPVSPTKKMESVHSQSDWKNTYDAFGCAKSAMSCALREMKELERKKVEAETEIRDQMRSLELALAEERRLHHSSQIACEEQMRKVMSLEQDREASHVRIQELESTLSALKIAEDDSKKRDQESQAILSSMEIDLRKLETESNELKRKETSMLAEQVKLRVERDELKQKKISMLAHQLSLLEERNELKWKADAQKLSWTNEKAILQSELHKARIEVRVMRADQLKLVAERDELKQQADAQNLSWTNEKTILQSELDAARTAIQAKKTEFGTKLESALTEKQDAERILEKRLASVEDERDAALLAVAQQTAQVLKCNTKLEIALIEKDTALAKKEIQLLASIHRCPHGAMNMHEHLTRY